MLLVAMEVRSVRKENDMALPRTEMRMVRWMCDVKVKYRVPIVIE